MADELEYKVSVRKKPGNLITYNFDIYRGHLALEVHVHAKPEDSDKCSDINVRINAAKISSERPIYTHWKKHLPQEMGSGTKECVVIEEPPGVFLVCLTAGTNLRVNVNFHPVAQVTDPVGVYTDIFPMGAKSIITGNVRVDVPKGDEREPIDSGTRDDTNPT